jgi:response regulator NasT
LAGAVAIGRVGERRCEAAAASSVGEASGFAASRTRDAVEWARPRSRRPVKGPAQVTIRVVIAEDEAIIRMDLRETLEEEGYEVVGETGRGDTAVELVRDLLPDLAILDIKMPGIDGLAAARIINAEKLCGVLVLTAFSQREVVEEARDAGALAYLVKPFQKSDLVPAIEVAIGRFRELRAMTGEIDALGEQLEARKAIDRAKGVLMDELDMSEQDAFTYIQRTAMSERSKMRQIADRIIAGTLRPPS